MAIGFDALAASSLRGPGPPPFALLVVLSVVLRRTLARRALVRMAYLAQEHRLGHLAT